MSTIQLRTDSILQIPFQNYQKDFTFIVNGEEFQTNKVVADLLSAKISRNHQIDPTISKFSFETNSLGDFQSFLDLLNFDTKEIPKEEIRFISEVIDKLETENLNITIPAQEIRIDNVVDLILSHEKCPKFYKSQLTQEINFFSENFCDVIETPNDNLLDLSIESIEKIISNKNLSLDSEDQLLNFINEIYSKYKTFSELYDYVYFTNVSSDSMKEFISIIDFDHITSDCWASLSKCLINEKVESKITAHRFRKSSLIHNCKKVPFLKNNLKGIFSYLKTKSSITNEVTVTQSSYNHGDVNKLLDIESTENYYCTKNQPDSWICFEFKNHTIIPSSYTIKSIKGGPNNHNLKSWVIEGSRDGKKWTQIDSRNNCPDLNGSFSTHNFSIVKKIDEGFKFLRIKQTGPSWYNNNDKSHHLDINSIEFYGRIF